MHVRTVRSAASALLVLALGAGVAIAQEAAQGTEQAPALSDAPEAGAAAALPADDDALPAGLDETAVLEEGLMVDPATLAADSAVPPLKPRPFKYAPPKTFDISRSGQQPDGSGTVTLKQQLPIDWDVKVGADLGLAGNAPATYDPLRPLGTAPAESGGAAWASVGLSDHASLDARVDPGADQARFAGTLKHSVPVGSALSVTLQNSLSVTDTLSSLRAAGAAAPSDTAAPPPVFGNEQTVKFNVLTTGTTLAAGLASASDDPVTHNKLSAEQKLIGPLSVSTSVTDVGQVNENRSVNARFKLHW